MISTYCICYFSHHVLCYKGYIIVKDSYFLFCSMLSIVFAIFQALLRPGFFEQVIHVDLPDHESRCAIWTGLLRGVPQEGLLSIPKLSEATEGYSGAEVSIILV